MKSIFASVLITCAVHSSAQTLRISEYPTSTTDPEIIQAVLSSPENMNARELGAWQMLCAGLTDGTEDFIREDIFGFATPRVDYNNELLRIQWTAPKGGESTAARMLESVFTKPLLSDEKLAVLRQRLNATLADDWTVAIAGDRGDFTLPTEFVRRFHSRAFRPEALTLVATPAAAISLRGRFADFRSERIARDIRVSAFGRFRGPDQATVQVWRAPEVRPTTNESAALLATVALGGGKTSLLHQICREKNAWSYRQEAPLLPGRNGWRPHLILAGADAAPEASVVLAALKIGAESLTASDLERVKALAESAIAGRNPLSPFWVGNSAPYSGSLADRIAWNALCRHWGLSQASPEALLADMKRVTLAELKEALETLLNRFR